MTTDLVERSWWIDSVADGPTDTIERYREMALEIPRQTVEATAAAGVLDEYDRLGIDKTEMRSDYIKVEGVRMLFMTIVVVVCTVSMVWAYGDQCGGVGYASRVVCQRHFNVGRGGEQFSTSSLIT